MADHLRNRRDGRPESVWVLLHILCPYLQGPAENPVSMFCVWPGPAGNLDVHVVEFVRDFRIPAG